MADTPLTKRLGVKPGHKLLILNAPEGYQQRLGALPEGAEIVAAGTKGQCNFVQVFVHSKSDVDKHAASAVAALKPDGLLWFTYPKKSAKIKTDVSRDVGWDALKAAGFEGIALISVDDTWSAMRFRPATAVKTRKKEG